METQETRPETVVTKDGTSINIYIGGQTPTASLTSAASLTSVILWGVILALAIPLILPQLGINLGNTWQQTWQQWQMSLMQPLPMAAPTTVTMVTPMQQEPVPVIAEIFPPIANVPSESTVPTVQAVALNREFCILDKGRKVTGLYGYSRPLADESIDSLPNKICHLNCIMQIDSAAGVELVNENREMRLVGSWYSTGANCEGQLNELAENQNQNQTQAGLQKTFWIPMLYGLEYAQKQLEQLQKKLNGENVEKVDKPETGKATPAPGWSLWELLPDKVKGWGVNGLLVLVALLLIITNFSGGLGKAITIVIAGVVLWWVL